MADIAYTVETAIKRFIEPNWCWADYCCDCDACRAGGVLVQEISKLRADLAVCQLERERLQVSERSAWNAAVVRDEQIERLKAELTRVYLRRDVLTYMLYQDGREPPREAVAGDLGV